MSFEKIHSTISSQHCSHCGGEADGFKCPECHKTEPSFNPLHRLDCPRKGKYRVKCKTCGEAEDSCTCVRK